MSARFVVFFVVLAIVLVAASFYVRKRVAEAFGLSRRGRAVVLGTMLAGVVATLLSRALALPPVGVVGFAVAVAILICTGFLGMVDLARLVTLPVRRLLRPAPTSAPATVTATAAATATASDSAAAAATDSAPAPAPTRRDFLAQATTGSIVLLGSGSAFYGALFGRHDYVVEEVPVKIPGLSKRLDGYTLVQLSDIHLGLFVGEPEMRAAEEMVRKTRPDRIVLTGDLLDNDPRYAEALGRLVRRLAPLSRDGVVAIPGNHDWYAGIDDVVAALAGAGARVLRNDGLVVGDAREGFALLGVEDVWASRIDPTQGPDLERALAAAPKDLPRVLLAHNPVYFPKAAGQVALQLSGHTHGGQVNVLLRPADLVLPHGYVAGMYERGGSKLYVNRGFGTAGPPLRVGAPPEVTRVVLMAG